ncbi:MAG TPA: hypothetical protein VK186_17650 [Candidatus Deferrimicrobium sp.]|nr:hypothetical protein [Candidatus Kapabacteria bacterium]HLP60672.1 hypothetical protein [Candidatus Deferrimicrobium sp.]
MNEKKQEAIVLLNDGQKTDKEGLCNSWPNILEYVNERQLDPLSCH